MVDIWLTHTYIYIYWLVFWNMNLIFPFIQNNTPNCLSYFSGGLKHRQPVEVSFVKMIDQSWMTDGGLHISGNKMNIDELDI